MVRCHDWTQLHAASSTSFRTNSFVRKPADAAQKYRSNCRSRSSINRCSSDIVDKSLQGTPRSVTEDAVEIPLRMLAQERTGRALTPRYLKSIPAFFCCLLLFLAIAEVWLRYAGSMMSTQVAGWARRAPCDSDAGHVFCKVVCFSIASRRTGKLNDLRVMASRMSVDCVDV
jgi:hypothetical protein